MKHILPYVSIFLITIFLISQPILANDDFLGGSKDALDPDNMLGGGPGTLDPDAMLGGDGLDPDAILGGDSSGGNPDSILGGGPAQGIQEGGQAGALGDDVDTIIEVPTDAQDGLGNGIFNALDFNPFDWEAFPEGNELPENIVDNPAVWQPLEDQVVQRGSPDNTIVYPNLALMCSDDDSAIAIRIVSTHQHYNLAFDRFDLIIRNLDPDYLGTQEVLLDCNGVEASFNLIVTIGTGAPARWNTLYDQVIAQGSPDGTVAYHNLAEQCTDPDDPAVLQVTSTHRHYNFAWDGHDLIINDLNPAYTGTDTIMLDCNGIPNSFDLSVIPAGSKKPKAETGEETLFKTGVFIGSIRIPEAFNVHPGDEVAVTINLKNSGTRKLENLRIAATIQELSVRDTAGPFDLRAKKQVSEHMLLRIPDNAEPGTYTVRFTIHNNDVSRVVHRELEIL